MSINCGHCDATHETVDEVRACAEEHPFRPEPIRTTPIHCGRKMAPIVYGYPSGEMHEAAAKGEIRLGGCMVGSLDPAWRCAVCGYYGYDPTGLRVSGLGHVRMDAGGVDSPKSTDPSWWMKVRTRLQGWTVGGE